MSFLRRLGTPLSPNNDWVQLANQILWSKLEEAYQLVFSSKVGRAGKPFRELYGALLIKQKAHLLNEARLNLEADIKQLVKQLHRAPPQTYKHIAHQEWTAYSRKPRRWAKTTRKQIKKQLQYIRRDLRYVDERLAQGGELTKMQKERLATIRKVYEQQTFMYAHHTHQVDTRIVSLSEPFIRLIKRGKDKAPVEFGPKINCSIMDGIVDIEHYSYQAFNESADLKAILNHYQDVHGYYPDIALAETTGPRKILPGVRKITLRLTVRGLAENPNTLIPRNVTMIRKLRTNAGRLSVSSPSLKLRWD